ncbi:MAG: hypothetical protein V3R66_05510 [Rhodospirillales bacterium]
MAVEIGEKFVKPEDPGTVWTVQRFIDLPGLPQHVELKTEGKFDRKIMLSVSAIMDRSLYRRVEKTDKKS